MPINPEAVGSKGEPAEHSWTEKDVMLYALGVGAATDELQFTTENTTDTPLRVLPTMAVVLAYPGNWLESDESTADYRKLLHGEQYLTLHRPIAPAGTVIGRTRVVDLLDKGKEKGAVLFTERSLIDKASGALVATMTSVGMLRGDGGFGGKPGPQPPPHRLPETAPALSVDLRTHPNSALIYRLSGDRNPLHADPKAAAAGGFKMPILHGLCTFGVAGRALIRACCGGDPARLRSMQVRFSAPVFPGEIIRTEMWPDGDRISFRARAVERDLIVLNNGLATVAD